MLLLTLLSIIMMLIYLHQEACQQQQSMIILLCSWSQLLTALFKVAMLSTGLWILNKTSLSNFSVNFLAMVDLSLHSDQERELLTLTLQISARETYGEQSVCMVPFTFSWTPSHPVTQDNQSRVSSHHQTILYHCYSTMLTDFPVFMVVIYLV